MQSNDRVFLAPSSVDMRLFSRTVASLALRWLKTKQRRQSASIVHTGRSSRRLIREIVRCDTW